MIFYWFDGHLDTVLNLTDREYRFNSVNTGYHVDFPRLQKSDLKIAVFAIFVEPDFIPDKTLERAFNLLESFYKLLENNPELQLIKDYSDICSVLSKENKIGILLSLEGGDCILSLSTLSIFYRLGVRMLSLTWNHDNHLGGGINSENIGLSKMGKKIIRKMNQLQMIIDISHLNRKSFYDVLTESKGPLVASHSNAYNVCNHPRNLTDNQIMALARRDGLIGINFYPPFLTNSKKAKIKDIIRHIDYIRKLTGKRHIGLGSDFDGIDKTPDNLPDISGVPKLFSALRKKCYNKEEMNFIARGNWLRVCKSILGGSK